MVRLNKEVIANSKDISELSADELAAVSGAKKGDVVVHANGGSCNVVSSTAIAGGGKVVVVVCK